MQRKKIGYNAIVIIIVISFVICVGGVFFCMLQLENNRFSKKIFDNLSCISAKFDANQISDITRDIDLEKLSPTCSWSGAIEFAGEKYKIYAYEFGCAEDAFQYYQNASRQNNAVRQLCFYYTYTSMGRTRYVAYYGNRAYKVLGGSRASFAEFMEYLCRDFPIDIVEEYYKEYGINLDSEFLKINSERDAGDASTEPLFP